MRQALSEPRNQSRQPYVQQAIDIAEGYSLWQPAPEHIELMAKNDDLRLTSCAGPKQSDHGSAKQSEHINHQEEHHPIRVASPAVSSFRQAHQINLQMSLIGRKYHRFAGASQPFWVTVRTLIINMRESDFSARTGWREIMSEIYQLCQ